jgi:hypothetical protein
MWGPSVAITATDAVLLNAVVMARDLYVAMMGDVAQVGSLVVESIVVTQVRHAVIIQRHAVMLARHVVIPCVALQTFLFVVGHYVIRQGLLVETVYTLANLAKVAARVAVANRTFHVQVSGT